MTEDSLKYFICPTCRSSLRVENVSKQENQRIKEGTLVCGTGVHRFPVVRFVPRFLSADDETSAFGFEWNKHPRTQLDSHNGMRLTEERFYRQTRWPRNLCGQKILEVGCGAGRFTEIALQTGAQVFSFDASLAVDANWGNHAYHPNLVLFQADLYQLPLRQNFFDKVFCFGMLQNTRDVAPALATIAKFTAPGGELAVDVFNKEYWRTYLTPLHLLRPITKRISHDRLYRWVSWLVPRLIPLSSWLRNHIPVIGWQLSGLLPLANYEGLLPTDSREQIREFSCLDTFDILSPLYISPQYPSTLFQWFVDAGYENIEFDREPVCAVKGRKKST